MKKTAVFAVCISIFLMPPLSIITGIVAGILSLVITNPLMSLGVALGICGATTYIIVSEL